MLKLIKFAYVKQIIKTNRHRKIFFDLARFVKIWLILYI